MKLKHILPTIALLCGASTAYADYTVTASVGDVVIDKSPVAVTFHDGMATITFDDNTSATCPRQLLNLSINYNGNTHIIDAIVSDPVEGVTIFDISGAYLGSSTRGLQSGIYIINGKKVFVK